ncbi:hypothetical protein AVEN_252447-1 [Araneus ventricosus]|uniref:Uncharacterized protein n=1 Tax=Araneus ventricosus TaxID=182803 RepID=A0A4Y2AQP8_ARAVE|nr:hypothetical protein AVEN_252447-1 [Araneus ventricosus]
MKEISKLCNDRPAQIINNVKSSIAKDIQPCLSNNDTLRRQINRAKHTDTPVEPNSPSEILDAFDTLKSLMPKDAEPIVKWFEENFLYTEKPGGTVKGMDLLKDALLVFLLKSGPCLKT